MRASRDAAPPTGSDIPAWSLHLFKEEHMSTKTYSEIRQDAYFKAALEIRSTQVMLFNDMVNPVELGNDANHDWALKLSRTTGEQAAELERLGHEQCIASTRWENRLLKSKDALSAAIDAYVDRRIAAVEMRRRETAATQAMVADMERDGLL